MPGTRMCNQGFPISNIVVVLVWFTVGSGHSVHRRQDTGDDPQPDLYGPYQNRNNRPCYRPETPESSQVQCMQSSGSLRSCTARCFPSYIFETLPEESELTIYCNRGTWRPPSFPACIADRSSECHGLTLRGHSRYNCTSHLDGVHCDIYCDGLYTNRYHCAPGQGWRPALPYCTKTNGGSNPSTCHCKFGGRCDEYGDCICPSGRTGAYCEKGGSGSNPSTCHCKFGGICDEYGLCICPRGRTGTYCEKSESGSNRNPCRCQSGGTCDEYGYCICPSGRSGTYCEKGESGTNRNPCRCQFGGTCNEYGYCICPPGRTGTYCEKANRSRMCSDPGTPRGSSRVTSDGQTSSRRDFYEGETLIYTCTSKGEGLHGKSLITCRKDGTWSAPAPTCVKLQRPRTVCPDPGRVANADRLNTDGSPSLPSDVFVPGHSVVFECRDGFLLSGRSLLICQQNGQWSGPKPKCTRTSHTDDPREDHQNCPHPGLDPNGEMEGGGLIDPRRRQQRFPFGSEVKFTCKEGYYMEGSYTISCLTTGWWSDVAPTCQTFDRASGSGKCESLGPISNGHIEVTRPESSEHDPDVPDEELPENLYPVDTRMEYFCDPEYVILGRKNLVCQLNGYWYPPEPPTCEKDCGRSYVDMKRRRMAHADTTVAGEWPWTVAVAYENGNNGSHLVCGAALVNERTVLTAAHCVTAVETYLLYFGKFYRYDLQDDDEVQVRKSSEIILHPEYDNLTYGNDIALIHFEPSVPYSERIQPICLPTPESTVINLRTGTEGVMTGWGFSEQGTESEELLKTELPVQETSICNESFERANLSLLDHPGTFCSGFPEEAIGPCRGDSGSPFVFHNADTDRYTLEGIVSFSLIGQCGAREMYAILTRVADFMTWIVENQII